MLHLSDRLIGRNCSQINPTGDHPLFLSPVRSCAQIRQEIPAGPRSIAAEGRAMPYGEPRYLTARFAVSFFDQRFSWSRRLIVVLLRLQHRIRHTKCLHLIDISRWSIFKELE